MDEKEREDLPLEEVQPLLDAPDADTEDDTQESGQQLYFGRFTPGVWHGGLLGLAGGYILMGLLGVINNRFNLGLRAALDSPVVRYGVTLLLAYGCGKLGGVLEKRREETNSQDS